jgi:excisionase family DNA binding protein
MTVERKTICLVDIPEATEILNCSRSKLYDYVKRGRLKLVKHGRASRLVVSGAPGSLDDLLQSLIDEAA